MPHPFRRALLLTMAALTLASCSAVGLDDPGEGKRAELLRQRAVWAQYNIATYRYTYQVWCFCALVAPVVIDVVGGELADAHYAESGDPVPLMHKQGLPTIEDLFDIVEEALDQRADDLRVAYHPSLGFPTTITIDYRFNTNDDEFEHSASDLRVFLTEGTRTGRRPAADLR